MALRALTIIAKGNSTARRTFTILHNFSMIHQRNGTHYELKMSQKHIKLTKQGPQHVW